MKIFLNCPQCGAEVNMEEDAFAFRCDYCTSQLKPVGRKEIQSFYISANSTKETVGRALVNVLNRKIGAFRLKQAWLSYAPYWRVHGLLFQWTFGRRLRDPEGHKHYDDFKELRAVNHDRSFPAFSYPAWEVRSLGLKTQFLKMRPYNLDKMGPDALLMGLEISHPQAVDIAGRIPLSNMSLGGTTDKIDIVKDRLIGEIFSLVYFPFYIFKMVQNREETLMLVDAVAHKLVKGQISIEPLIAGSGNAKIPYQPIKFIPLACPHCNWNLPYQPDSRIHMCTSCGKAWGTKEGRFKEVSYTLGLHEGSLRKGCQYLPFWKLEVAIVAKERTYVTLADFYALFRLQHSIAKDTLSKRKIQFFIPAFRTSNVNAMDKIAAQMIRLQPLLQEMEPGPDITFKSTAIRISQKEAVEMSHLLIYSLAPKGVSKIFKTIESAQLDVKTAGLIWLPFKEQGRYLKGLNTGLSIEKGPLAREAKGL